MSIWETFPLHPLHLWISFQMDHSYSTAGNQSYGCTCLMRAFFSRNICPKPTRPLATTRPRFAQEFTCIVRPITELGHFNVDGAFDEENTNFVKQLIRLQRGTMPNTFIISMKTVIQHIFSICCWRRWKQWGSIPRSLPDIYQWRSRWTDTHSFVLRRRCIAYRPKTSATRARVINPSSVQLVS